MSKLTEIKKQTNTGRTHFKKGSIPWNAGKMKMVTFVCEMCDKEVTKQDKGDGRPNRFCSLKCSAKNLQKPEILKKRVLSTTGTRRTAEQRANISGEKAKLWKGGKSRFTCMDCGVAVANMYADRCTPCKAKYLVGERHHRWKGGHTPELIKIRTSKEYKLWQDSVFNKDDNTCQRCGEGYTSKLVAHHVLNFAQYPELRLAIDNGITFCKVCHKEFHLRYKKKNNTGDQVQEFLTKKHYV